MASQFFLNFENKTCDTTCPSGYVTNPPTNECLKCGGNCQTCTGSITGCTSCKAGFFLQKGVATCISSADCIADKTWGNPITRKCEDCNGACTFCFGPAATNCTECVKGSAYYLDVSKSTCTLTCPDGTYNGI